MLAHALGHLLHLFIVCDMEGMALERVQDGKWDFLEGFTTRRGRAKEIFQAGKLDFPRAAPHDATSNVNAL